MHLLREVDEIFVVKNSIGNDAPTNVVRIFSEEVETQICYRLPKLEHRSQGLLQTVVVKCLYH